MRAVIIALLAVALPVSALAQPATDPITIEWIPPTEYEYGGALDPAVEIAEYRLYCYRPDNEPERYLAIPGLSDVTEHTATREEVFGNPGSYYCHMTAVSIDDMESVPSNVAYVRWRGRPGPVQILVIE